MRRRGAADAPAAVCVPGLPVNLIGIIPAWDQYRDRYFLYERRDVSGGVAARSGRGAVLEDLGYGEAMYWSDPAVAVGGLVS